MNRRDLINTVRGVWGRKEERKIALSSKKGVAVIKQIVCHLRQSERTTHTCSSDTYKPIISRPF